MVTVEICHALLSSYDSYLLVIKLRLSWNKAYQTISLALPYLIMLSQTRLNIVKINFLYVFISIIFSYCFLSLSFCLCLLVSVLYIIDHFQKQV
jgi:hypothetical protein